MPGISANLTPQAFAIWEEIEKKKRGSDPRGSRNQGRSKWLSHVIIEHQSWTARHHAALKKQFQLEKELRVAMNTINELQKRIHE